MHQLNDENFEKEIKNSQKPVLVDFFTEWCYPCQILSPILEKIAEDSQEKFILVKVNLDAVPLTAQKFGIDRIPSVVLFKEGKPATGFVGLQPEEIIRQWLKENLNSEKENMEKIIQEYEVYARQKGFKLNPTKEVVERIVRGLLINEEKYGKRYCPCRRVTGNPKEDAKNICPCVYHLAELDKNGHCLCRLFLK